MARLKRNDTMYMFTSNQALQTAFRREFKDVLDFKLIPDYSGNGKMYKTDTRVEFCDWLDSLRSAKLISERLAQSAYLEPKTKKGVR